MADDEVMVAEKFPQDHEELVFQETWWWAVHICLCVIAVLANLIFIITVVYNRYEKSHFGGFFFRGDEKKRENGEVIRYRRKENMLELVL